MPGFSSLLQQFVIDLLLNQLFLSIITVMAPQFDTFMYLTQQPCSIPVSKLLLITDMASCMYLLRPATQLHR